MNVCVFFFFCIPGEKNIKPIILSLRFPQSVEYTQSGMANVNGCCSCYALDLFLKNPTPSDFYFYAIYFDSIVHVWFWCWICHVELFACVYLYVCVLNKLASGLSFSYQVCIYVYEVECVITFERGQISFTLIFWGEIKMKIFTQKCFTFYLCHPALLSAEKIFRLFLKIDTHANYAHAQWMI